VWVVLVGETLTVDVGLSTVNDLANPLYMDMRVFESAGDAARFAELHNPAGLQRAGGVRLWNVGGGYMRANQDDSLAMTEASSVVLLVHKNLTGGDPTCERIEVPQKIIVLTGNFKRIHMGRRRRRGGAGHRHHCALRVRALLSSRTPLVVAG
jgi:hypothetical protein